MLGIGQLDDTEAKIKRASWMHLQGEGVSCSDVSLVGDAGDTLTCMMSAGEGYRRIYVLRDGLRSRIWYMQYDLPEVSTVGCQDSTGAATDACRPGDILVVEVRERSESHCSDTGSARVQPAPRSTKGHDGETMAQALAARHRVPSSPACRAPTWAASQREPCSCHGIITWMPFRQISRWSVPWWRT